MRIGVLPLGRPTFDMELAEEKRTAFLDKLNATSHEIVGPTTLLVDNDEASAAVLELSNAAIDQLLILQVTFTDASLVAEAAQIMPVPISIWAVPEPRTGGRLRLNSFCGLNLASHALSLRNREFSWLYADPSTVDTIDIEQLFTGERRAGKLLAVEQPVSDPCGLEIVEHLRDTRIGRIGKHPAGFDTCAFDPPVLDRLANIKVEDIELEQLFDRARCAGSSDIDTMRCMLDKQVGNAGSMDQRQLDRSLRLKFGLDQLRQEKGYAAFAIRCWPEMFTEYGGAVCGPVSMLGDEQVPCACEADVCGALTQVILQKVSGEAVFLTDLVDVDVADDTAVVWHCGQAPMSMRDPSATVEATVHTNRKQPLLYQFALKPGPVTLMRISRAHGQSKMILGVGEMLRRPLAFSGTSGVLRFHRDAGAVLGDLIASGLEHHMALVYGDHVDRLRSVSGALGLPLLEI